MKSFNKKSILLVALITTVLSYPSFGNMISEKKTKIVTVVRIENVNKGSTLYIKDSVGVELYKERIKKTGLYTNKFNLTNLPDAAYYFQLNKANETRIIPFTVEASIVEFVKAKEFSIDKPDVEVIDDRVYISSVSADQQLWEISVYFENGDLAFSEKLDKTQMMKRVYDFSSSEKGNYTIVFSSKGRKFEEGVHIK